MRAAVIRPTAPASYLKVVMAGILISGPAGAGKSEAARAARAEMSGPAVILDFQAIYAALLGIERGPDGRFPARLASDEFALATTEYVRKAAITGARAREIGVILTNSDGDPGRRAALLADLGPGAAESVIDPGEDEVMRRLSRPGVAKGSDGRRVSKQCRKAVGRWYGRTGGRRR